MRILREIPHPDCKITVLHWNNRYLIKIEQGLLEQTFKINQFDVLDEEEAIRLIDATFVKETLDRFLEMRQSLHEAQKRLE